MNWNADGNSPPDHGKDNPPTERKNPKQSPSQPGNPRPDPSRFYYSCHSVSALLRIIRPISAEQHMLTPSFPQTIHASKSGPSRSWRWDPRTPRVMRCEANTRNIDANHSRRIFSSKAFSPKHIRYPRVLL